MEVFTLKEEHIKLLRRAVWRYEECEFGAPAMDCKRPYGNSSVVPDIAEILGEESELCPHCQEPLDDANEDRFISLHHELVKALEVIFTTHEFEIGAYAKVGNEYSRTWEKEKQDD